MEGALRFLQGEDVETAEIELPGPAIGEALPVGAVSEEYLATTEQEEYGYCTQFLIQGQGLDVDAIREKLTSMADSTVVIGDESMVKVHLHTFDPGPIISYAVSVGTLGQVRIDNIDQQHQEFLEAHRRRRQVPALAVVAVAWGDGFARLFKNLGALGVIVSGETMNPSTEELLEAAEATVAKGVIILPNNSNIIPAAKQACSISQRPLYMVPSKTLPQGVAALLAFNPETEVEANLKAMEQAIGSVRTIEITTSVRPATLAGLEVKEGQPIGFLDGELVAAADSPLTVLNTILKSVGLEKGNLVTLYWGGDTTEEQARQAAESIKASFQGVDVEVVYGGQPFYHYIASIE
jgi:hypothetical protein